MDVRESLNILKQKQEQLLLEYGRLTEKIEGLDWLRENEGLKRAITECQDRSEALERQYRQVAKENQELRLSLREQIVDEKLSILKVSREKLTTYFGVTAQGHENRLVELEATIRKKVDELNQMAAKNLETEKESISQELALWSAGIQTRIERRREEFRAALAGSMTVMHQRLGELADEEVSDETIQQRIRQNEIEMKIGLNWVNKLGIILILFGIGAAAKYTYSTWFNDTMRGTFIFLVGGLLLAAGEWFYRRDKSTFAAGLLGGGISVLYCGVFYSYFLLKIIGLFPGMGLSTLVTVTAVVMAVRYRSRTICAMGLIGGYLPFFTYVFAFGLKGEAYYIAMGYLFLLNFAVMLVSFRQKWNIVNYASMLFHAPSLLYLVYGVPDKVIGIVYATAAFANYLGMTLAYPLKYREGLKRADVILLGFNTVFSCTVLYGLFTMAGFTAYHGLLALGFCLVYGSLGQITDRLIPTERYTRLLFYATSLTFAILMIPFQFGIRWVSMGWLAEGVILIIYGMKYRLDRMEKSGWLIFGLCLTAFYAFDWLQMLKIGGRQYFDYKYLAVVAGMTVVTGAYLHDIARNGVARYGLSAAKIHWFKYFTIINLWVYLLDVSGKAYSQWTVYGYYTEFYRILLGAAVTLMMAYVVPRIKLVRDQVVYFISLVWYGLVILKCCYLNLTIPVLQGLPGNIAAEYTAMAILCAYNLFILAIMRQILPAILQRHYLNLELYPLVVLLFLLGNTTAFLTVQFKLESTHLLFSLIYLFMAIGAIYYGFQRRFVYVRRAGLTLALLATTKLFIYDLSFLTSLNKIFAYFWFGIVLLGISYLYQRLKSSVKGDRHV